MGGRGEMLLRRETKQVLSDRKCDRKLKAGPE